MSKEECAFTLESHTTGTGSVEAYTYEKDRLENYGGENITYDKVGNPLTYRGNALKWERGRKLVEYGTNKFRYDAQGRRTAKNGINYVYDSNDRLIAEGSVMEYFYDITGLLGFKYGNEQYVYRKDAQGNITAILDSSRAVVVEYYYDAWGNHKWTGDETLAKRNPFRYRGYYYDEETGLYFLKSRYYDPQIGRFINIDSVCYIAPELLNGLNLYAYCLNNPVMNVDPTGQFPWLILAILAFVLLSTPVGGTVLQLTASAISYVGIAIASIFDEDIRNDMNAIGWNPFNIDETATLNSSKVSFYKGVPVFRTASGGRSGSFGAIFLAKGRGVDALRHERGHNSQLMMMGIADYGLMIGLPSWQEWSSRPYYERPWEITADVFGGVTGRTHSQADINRGYWYLGVSSLFGPFGYFFLFGEY